MDILSFSLFKTIYYFLDISFCLFYDYSACMSLTYFNVRISSCTIGFLYTFFMDQTALQIETITSKLPALLIEGAGDKLQNLMTPLYKQPGYSTSNLGLLELLMKPIYLPPIEIDSTFTRWIYPLNAMQPLIHDWISRFIENFKSPRFNVLLTFVCPGHQFAVGKFGLAYLPNMLTNGDLPTYSRSTPPFQPSIATTASYNGIRSLNGVFFEVTDTSKTIAVQSSIPTNYPMNPMDLTLPDRAPLFGGFRFTHIGPVRFGMSLTSITVRPMISLVDVTLTPWAH
nr:MAG: hypothetical protein [Wufeng shrew polycipivirus 4]